MILADAKNEAQLIALIPSIKQYMNEWQVVNIRIRKDCKYSKDEVLKFFMIKYKDSEGIMYPVSADKVVMLARLGDLDNYAVLKQDVEKTVPGHSCRVLLRKLTEVGMKQVQLDLSDKGDEDFLAYNLFSQRSARQDNVVLIADDDEFVRKAMKALLGFNAKVYEVGEGQDVLAAYKRYNPDILFLDIHMPGKTGLELIPEIVSTDSDAFILVMSGDSQRENVLTALEEGAAGFLTKPPAKLKVQEYLRQCITFI